MADAGARRPWPVVLLRLIGLIALAGTGLAAFALLLLDSPLGHRLVTDRIAALRLQSGLVITIGRIDGSLFGTSQLHEVVLGDPAGRFMTVPEAALDWRPLSAMRLVLGLGGGLDIRNLALHRGLLLRAPRLNPSDPDAPILPDFDIRLDRLAIDSLTVAPGVAGARRRIDFVARAQIHDGRVVLDCDGRLGGRDKLVLHLDSEPDRDRFALHLDYRAPRGGLLAALSGVQHTIVARIDGAGHFAEWHGWVLADADGQRLVGGRIHNRAGHYRLAALVRPSAAIGGLGRQLAGDRLGLTFAGTFAGGRIAGHYHGATALGRIDGTGTIDLAHNRAEALALGVQLVRPDLLPAAWRDALHPGPARLNARLDGPFADLAVTHDLTVTRLTAGKVRFDNLHSAGVAHWHGQRLDVPLAAQVARIATGTRWLDQQLTGVRLTGLLRIDRATLSGDDWRVIGHGLSGKLALNGDLRRGAYALAGRIDARGVDVPQLGLVDATTKGVLVAGNAIPWTIAVNYSGTVSHPANAALAALAGGPARVSGSLHWGAKRALSLPDMHLVSPSVNLAVNAARAPDGQWAVTGEGHHVAYGAFDARATIGGAGTSAQAHFASPLPAAGITAVSLMLDSTPSGYQLAVRGDSRAGPIVAAIDFAVASAAGPARVVLRDVRMGDTRLAGTLTLNQAGLDGELTLAGGGLDGTARLAGRNGATGLGGQAVDITVNAHAARFGGDRPIVIGAGTLTVKGLFSNGDSTIDGSLKAQGVAIGGVFIGRLLADATMVNGSGSVTASLAGRRGTQFTLQGTAAVAPDRVIAYLAGDYAGNKITMPRRAVITRDAQGWRLEPSQISFGSGAIVASGRFGMGDNGLGPSQFHLAVSRMPLSVLDIVYADLGLGGYASGVIDVRNDHTGAPEGKAALSVMGLTRSGLVLTSRPLDLALVGQLDASALQMRAVAREGKVPRMRLQAQIADLPRGGTALERLRAGKLTGQLRYAGPADALWRLAAIDAFDLTGPIGIAADVGGSLDAPVLTGAIASHGLRAQSAISGSDVQNITLAGSFNGAKLSLAHFSGTTTGGGRVAGSGTIDLSDVSTQRPKIDLRIGATQAQLVDRPEMAATITGPVRIVSDGQTGTVAGRLKIDRARWVLGRASAAQTLPTLKLTERNVPIDFAPPPRRGPPWKLLIDAVGANRIDVRGMGLQSEWQTAVRVRGDTVSPQIFGTAEVVRGSYEFAGKRFDLTRGRITFNGETPIDPQLDIVATGDANDISATISIGGSSQHPLISFASVPALPEEELLSRILFGSSISQISGPEAVQLASALAALRGGGGLDPINKLRGAIGLDRLRVVSPDPTIGRGTALAVGKYLGRKFYIELVTDGHGYNATSIEFRLTRWLSLLGTVSTLYDESISLKFTKDY